MIVRLPVSKMGASRSDAAPRDVATGLPGGRRIIAVGAQLAQRVIDFAASPQQAAEATRLHVVVEEPLEVRPDMDEELVIGLEKMGHRIKRNNNIGGMAHIAEYLREEQKTRAGGGGWAAGV
jgi:gamma-glutamyltranspeptidase